jgi:hypothetical protein
MRAALLCHALGPRPISLLTVLKCRDLDLGAGLLRDVGIGFQLISSNDKDLHVTNRLMPGTTISSFKLAPGLTHCPLSRANFTRQIS